MVTSTRTDHSATPPALPTDPSGALRCQDGPLAWPFGSHRPAMALWVFATLVLPILASIDEFPGPDIPARELVFQLLLLVVSILVICAAVVDRRRTLGWLGGLVIAWALALQIGAIPLLAVLAIGVALLGTGAVTPPARPEAGRVWIDRSRILAGLLLAAAMAFALHLWLEHFYGLILDNQAILLIPALVVIAALLGEDVLPIAVMLSTFALWLLHIAPEEILFVTTGSVIVVVALYFPHRRWAVLALPSAFAIFVTVAISSRQRGPLLASFACLLIVALGPPLARALRPEGDGAPTTWRHGLDRAMGRILQGADAVVDAVGRRVVAVVRSWFRADPLRRVPAAEAQASEAPGNLLDRLRPWATPFAIWAAGQGVVLAVSRQLGRTTQTWVQWDSHIFLNIAERGPVYPADAQPTVTSFPGYPLLIRGLTELGSSPEGAAVFISVVAGFAAVMLFWAWMTEKGVTGAARTTGALLLVAFPYGFFLFGMAYSDGLFLALALACMLLVERKHPIAAGLVGAIATATRPTGLALLAGVVVAQLDQIGFWDRVRPFPRLWSAAPATDVKAWVRDTWHRRPFEQLRPAHLGVALTALGIGSYGAYCWYRWGDPIAFWSAQRWYGHGSALDLKTWRKSLYLEEITKGLWPGAHLLNTGFQTALTLLAGLSIPAISRRFGVGYGVFMACLFVQTWIGDDILSVGGRYLMAAFPLFALAGAWLSTKPIAVRIVVLACSAALSVFFLTRFTDSVGFPIW